MDDARLASDSLRLLESLGRLPEPAAQPFFILVSGLPGTGKSFISRRLAEKLPATVIESDAMRKILFPKPNYSSGESTHLFSTVHMLLGSLISKGISVILDATNLSEHSREYLYNIGEQQGAKLIVVQVEAPNDVVKKRIQGRRYDTANKSDADWVVYQKLKPSAEKIRRKHYVVDTSKDVEPVLGKIIREALR